MTRFVDSRLPWHGYRRLHAKKVYHRSFKLLLVKLSVFKNALKFRNLHLIHTSEKCLVKPGLTELNSETEN